MFWFIEQGEKVLVRDGAGDKGRGGSLFGILL